MPALSGPEKLPHGDILNFSALFRKDDDERVYRIHGISAVIFFRDKRADVFELLIRAEHANALIFKTLQTQFAAVSPKIDEKTGAVKFCQLSETNFKAMTLFLVQQEVICPKLLTPMCSRLSVNPYFELRITVAEEHARRLEAEKKNQEKSVEGAAAAP